MIRISCLGYSNSTDNVITSLLKPTFAQDTRQTCFAVVLLCEFALYFVLWIFLLELCSIKRVACDVCIFETANCFLRQTRLSSRLESKFQFYPTTDLYLTPSPYKPTPPSVCMHQITHTHSMQSILTSQTPSTGTVSKKVMFQLVLLWCSGAGGGEPFRVESVCRCFSDDPP